MSDFSNHLLFELYNFSCRQHSSAAGEMDMIEKAINEYHRRTCVRFKPRTNERDYISFTSDATGCWSSVGRIGGKQVNGH